MTLELKLVPTNMPTPYAALPHVRVWVGGIAVWDVLNCKAYDSCCMASRKIWGTPSLRGPTMETIHLPSVHLELLAEGLQNAV